MEHKTPQERRVDKEAMQVYSLVPLEDLREVFGVDSELVLRAAEMVDAEFDGISRHNFLVLLAQAEPLDEETARKIADVVFWMEALSERVRPETHYWPPRVMNPFSGRGSFFEPFLDSGMGSPRSFVDGRIDPPRILRTPASLRIQGGVGSSVFEGLDLSGYMAALNRVARRRLDQPVDYEADNDPANKLIITLPALAFGDITVATRVALALEGKCSVSETQVDMPTMKVIACGHQMYPLDVRSAINDLGYTCTISSTIRVHLAMAQGDQWVEIPADRPRLSILKLEQHPAFWQNYSEYCFWRRDQKITVMTELLDGDEVIMKKG